MFLTICKPSSNMSHVGSKTRLPGQIVGNFWLHSRGYICNLILMKLGQNVCFWQYLGQVRKHVMSGQKLGHQFKYEEILVYTLDVTFATWFWWYFVRMFVLTISRPSSNMGHVGSKTRSPGQILGHSCLHSRGHICDPILMKLCQNVCFDNI